MGDAEVEARLEQLAHTGRTQPDQAPVPGWVSPWIAISALHKSIRRGYVDQALRMTEHLLKVDPDRFWGRIAVIALEDVGLGNPGMVAAAAYCEGKSILRREIGARDLALGLVGELASGDKDRSACDVVGHIGRMIAARKYAGDLVPESAGERLRAACSQGEGSTIEVAFASTAAVEKDGMSRAQLADWFEGNADLSPDEIRVIRYSKGQAQGMALVFGALAAEARAVGALRAEPDAWFDQVDLEPLNGVVPAALDQYTREGLRSLAYFLKACSEFQEWLREHRLPADISPVEFLGRVVFRAEGDALNRRLQLPTGLTARIKYNAGTAKRFGLEPTDFDEAISIVRRNLSLLRRARGRILGLISSSRSERSAVAQ